MQCVNAVKLHICTCVSLYRMSFRIDGWDFRSCFKILQNNMGCSELLFMPECIGSHWKNAKRRKLLQRCQNRKHLTIKPSLILAIMMKVKALTEILAVSAVEQSLHSYFSFLRSQCFSQKMTCKIETHNNPPSFHFKLKCVSIALCLWLVLPCL